MQGKSENKKSCIRVRYSFFDYYCVSLYYLQINFFDIRECEMAYIPASVNF